MNRLFLSSFESRLLDQLTGTVDSLGGVSSFTYDGDGDLLTVTDPNHHTTTYTYDSMDHRARYYNPTVGRFLSEDPVGFQSGQNFYAYAANDPIGSRDPLGLFATDDRIKLTRSIDIDYACTSGGACTTNLKAKVECNCQCGDEGWKATATLVITGNMYVSSGRWPYKGTTPTDKSVHDADSAIAHEYTVHINPAIKGVTPSIDRLEAKTFASEKECRDECKKTSDWVGKLFGAVLTDTKKTDLPPER